MASIFFQCDYCDLVLVDPDEHMIGHHRWACEGFGAAVEGGFFNTQKEQK